MCHYEPDRPLGGLSFDNTTPAQPFHSAGHSVSSFSGSIEGGCGDSNQQQQKSGQALGPDKDSNNQGETLDFLDIDFDDFLTDVPPHEMDQSENARMGPDMAWTHTWANALSSDFSTLAPISFLDRHVTGKNLKETVGRVSTQLISKTREGLMHELNGQDSLHLTGGPEHNRIYEQITAQRYVDAYFAERFWYSPFLRRDDFDRYFGDFLVSDGMVEPAFAALANGVLAIGCEILSRLGQDPKASSLADSRRSMRYFQAALRHRDNLVGGRPSMTKLRALVTLILFSSGRRDSDLARSLLSSAIFQIQSLGLFRPKKDIVGGSKEEDQHAKSIFWLLYSIEKPFVLRFGGYSVSKPGDSLLW